MGVYNLNNLRKNDNKKIIIFDDDPTGSQTVHNIPLYLEFDEDIIENAILDDSTKGFFVLTNTRAMNEKEATELNRDLSYMIDVAATKHNIDYGIISRGDSTLRGHFPLELDVIKRNITKHIDGYILLPFFKEGGRVTLDDVHYIIEDDQIIPVGETQFAKDHTFGYDSSNLKDYVVEKYGESISREEVLSISLDMLRENKDEVFKTLMGMNNQICIVNAQTYEDLDSFVSVLLKAEKECKNFLFRTAASFVKSRLGLKDKELINAQEVDVQKQRGGVIVVGSYVDKSVKQLNYILENMDLHNIIIDVDDLLKNNKIGSYIEHAKIIDDNIKKGRDSIISTSSLVVNNNKNLSSLEIGNIVSSYLSNIINSLTERPAFVVAKGGITSYDIAYKGLHVKKVIVEGQIIYGVPIWITGEESKFSDLLYVVFPGNVGSVEDLYNVVKKLRLF